MRSKLKKEYTTSSTEKLAFFMLWCQKIGLPIFVGKCNILPNDTQNHLFASTSKNMKLISALKSSYLKESLKNTCAIGLASKSFFRQLRLLLKLYRNVFTAYASFFMAASATAVKCTPKCNATQKQQPVGSDQTGGTGRLV